MSATPTADQIACAIVTACRRTGDNPESVATGRSSCSCHGRVYAFVALAIAFPDVSQKKLATWCGAGGFESFVGGALSACRDRPRWWTLDKLNSVLAAIGHPPATEQQAEIRRLKGGKTVAQAVAEAAPSSGRQRRVIDRRVTEPVSFGEPLPGRSALDQGYRPGSGLARVRA